MRLKTSGLLLMLSMVCGCERGTEPEPIYTMAEIVELIKNVPPQKVCLETDGGWIKWEAHVNPNSVELLPFHAVDHWRTVRHTLTNIKYVGGDVGDVDGELFSTREKALAAKQTKTTTLEDREIVFTKSADGYSDGVERWQSETGWYPFANDHWMREELAKPDF